MNPIPNQSPAEDREWQYRSIFDAANDGTIINDLETGRVGEANRKKIRRAIAVPSAGQKFIGGLAAGAAFGLAKIISK